MTRTCRTSGSSALPTAGWCSTSTTSTRRCPGRSSGTSSGSPPAWPWPGATSGCRAKDRKTLVLPGSRPTARHGRVHREEDARGLVRPPRHRGRRWRRWARRSASSRCTRTRKAMAKARTRDSMQVLKKLTTVVDGQRRFISNPPLVVPIEELTDRAQRRRDHATGWPPSCASTAARSAPTAGTWSSSSGSSGSPARSSGSAASAPAPGCCCSRPTAGSEPLFLQAKEAQRSVLADYCGASKYRNEGQRVVAGQHLMQAASDIFLGWQHVDAGLDGGSRDFYVRQLRDWKYSAESSSTMVLSGLVAVRRAVRLDPRPCARPLGRPVRHRGLPGQVRQVRPGPGHVRRGLRRPQRGRPRGPGRRGHRRADRGRHRHLTLLPFREVRSTSSSQGRRRS